MAEKFNSTTTEAYDANEAWGLNEEMSFDDYLDQRPVVESEEDAARLEAREQAMADRQPQPVKFENGELVGETTYEDLSLRELAEFAHQAESLYGDKSTSMEVQTMIQDRLEKAVADGKMTEELAMRHIDRLDKIMHPNGTEGSNEEANAETDTEKSAVNVLDELTDEEIKEYEAQKADAKKSDWKPANIDEAFFNQEQYEGKLEGNADEVISNARKLFAEGDEKAARAAYKDIEAKLRQELKEGKITEDEFSAASVAVLAEMTGLDEEAVQKKMNGEKIDATDAEEKAEPVAKDSGDKPADPHAEKDINGRLDDYAAEAIDVSEEHKAFFNKIREEAEASDNETEPKKKGRVKRFLARLGLRKSGVERPSFKSRIRQDAEYRDYVRAKAAKRSEKVTAKAEKRAGKAEAKEQAKEDAKQEKEQSTDDDNESDDSKERTEKERYEQKREEISKILEAATKALAKGKQARAKELYYSARGRLYEAEPWEDDNEDFNSVFDDDFYAEIDALADKLIEDRE